MKILILNHYASIPDYGSAETRHYEIGKRLVKKGHEVTVAIGDYSHLLGRKWTDTVGNREFLYNGVKFLIVKAREYSGNGLDRFLSSVDYSLNGFKTLKDIPFDVIVASSPHPLTWILGRKLAKKRGAPLILEIRDVWPDDLVSSGIIGKRNPVTFFFRRLCKKYYPLSDAIITLLPEIDDHIRNLKLTKVPPVVFIPNGINPSDFQDYKRCPEVDKMFSKIPKSTLKVIYTGSHGPSNGLEFVINAIKVVPKTLKEKFSFIFVGSGPLKKKLIELAKDEEAVYFLDPIPKSCVPHLIMEKSDILLFSLADFPNTKYPAFSSFKLLDYMASGKPILSVYHEGLILNRTRGAVFYNYDDVDSFSKALEKISSSFEKLHILGKRNKSYVERERNWDVLSEKFENLLLEISRKEG